MYPPIYGPVVGSCWVVYDETLIKRVMLLFSFDCLDCWGEEVMSMN